MWKKYSKNPRFEVSPDGNIRTWHGGWRRYITPSYREDKDGYLTFAARDISGSSTTYRVHRVIAETLIPNPDNLPVVNHLNGVKNDNRIENLRWSTIAENTQHAYDYLGVLSAQSKHVRLFIDGKHYSDYQSITRMCELMGVDRNTYKEFCEATEGYFTCELISDFTLNSKSNLPLWEEKKRIQTRGFFYKINNKYYDNVNEAAEDFGRNRTTIHSWVTKGSPEGIVAEKITLKEYLKNAKDKKW